MDGERDWCLSSVMPAAFEVGQHKKEVSKRKGIVTVLIVNLVPSRIIWEEHLSVELSRSGWPVVWGDCLHC